MDVLDPAEIIAAVGVVPDGMKLAEVVRVINDIAKEKEIVGLTVAEPMPRIAIRIKEMLNHDTIENLLKNHPFQEFSSQIQKYNV